MADEMEAMREKMEALEMENRLLRQTSGTPVKPAARAIVYKSDTLEMLKKLPAAEYDLLYTNPPFGTTGAAWDKPLPWDQLWPEIWRVLKPNGAAVLHCSMPFTYDLAASQREFLKYHYTWGQTKPGRAQRVDTPDATPSLFSTLTSRKPRRGSAGRAPAVQRWLISS